MISGWFGKTMEKQLRVPVASSLVLSADPNRQLALTRIHAPQGFKEPSGRIPREKAYSFSVHLRRPGAVEGWGSWMGGHFRPVRFWDVGGMEIFNLEADPIALRPSGFEAVHVHLPAQTIHSYSPSATKNASPTCRDSRASATKHSIAGSECFFRSSKQNVRCHS